MSTQSSPQRYPDNYDRVAVLWDMETCPVLNTYEAGNHICRTLRARHFKGPFELYAYGDFTRFTQRVRQGLYLNLIQCCDVPKGFSCVNRILTQLAFCALDNPPPACIMLISSNDNYCDALHRLAMRGYTVILAIPSWVHASSPLRDAGRFVWDWPSLSETSRSFTYPHMANTNMSTQSSSQQYRIRGDGYVAILWDIESCPIPSNISTEEAANNIEMALRLHQINGAIKMFSAYGDFTTFSEDIIIGLQRASVECRDVPRGTNPVNTILVDMFSFSLDYSTPSYIMVISGDDEFCYSLNRLGMYAYTVILAIPSVVGVTSYLRDAVKFVWDWPSLSKTSRSLSSRESTRKQLKHKVQGLLNRHRGEIVFNSFEDLYKDQFKDKLDYDDYGLTDLEDLCEFLKDILVVGVTPSGAKVILLKVVN